MASTPSQTCMSGSPLCSAAHTALLIDVDKGVRPCCAYEGGHLPGSPSVERLGVASLAEIVNGPTWTAVRQQLARHEVPPGCVACIEREGVAGWSQRLMMEKRRSPNWASGITYLELSSSNLCNLQCRHCGPLFSSRWARHAHRHGRQGPPVVQPDGDLLLRNLRSVDLSHLDYVSIKGGEPMLNSDVAVLLEHLERIGVFQNVTIDMVTNGTQLDPTIVALLGRARECRVCLSIDGIGDVQTYIRHGASAIDRIEKAIAVYAAMPNVTLTRNTSVMVYNVFQLDRIDTWWTGLSKRFPGHYTKPGYGLFVLWPEELSLSVLQDATRARLCERYAALDPVLYAPVLRVLQQPFAGAVRHNAFVRTTERVDRELGRTVLDAVPELTDEMVLLPEPGRETAPVASAPAAGEPTEFLATIAAGWRSLELGDIEGAAHLARQAQGTLVPEYGIARRADLLHLLSAVTALRGDLPRAFDTISEALRLLPDHGGLHLHRGRILDALGRRAGAVAEVEAALGDPTVRDQAEALLASWRSAAS